MENKHCERLKRFIRAAFFIWENNPVLNLSGFCTVSGITIFGICMIIQTCGLGTAPEPIIEIGKAAFYIGLGGSIEKSRLPKGEAE